MSEAIRVLHFADTHVGVESYGKTDADTGLSSRVRDFLRRMDEMIDYAKENDVDLVIFAGDAFKTRSPNPTYQREFAHRVNDLAELAPTVLLVGNHDLPPNVMRASSIEIFSTLRVQNVHVADRFDVFTVETKRGSVAVGAAPYPMPSWLLEDINTTGLSIHDIDLTVEEVLAERLEELAQRVDEYDMPRLLTGHFTVGGAVVGSERNIMLGRDVSVSLSALADDRWDYVALGHIHKHQNMTAKRSGAPPVVYSGSMERIDFGEEGDPKGFCWIELARNETKWRYVPVKARKFITIRRDLRDSANPTQELVNAIRELDVRGTVVRVLLKLTPESESKLNEAAVRRTLSDGGVFYIAAVSRDVEQPARMRLGMSPEGLSPEELLERYLISKEVGTERRQQLLASAREIFQSVISQT